ncbi:MAG: hypothetical protein CM15mP87_09370 [Candidatus Neomarinimicrobiota bacterium]|nr:MAG: hypothetical protein CM15mP87_09370 [Candidatus Neomarinimicrobiota bacterium]
MKISILKIVVLGENKTRCIRLFLRISDLCNVARRWITKNPNNKIPISINGSGQNQIIETSFPIFDNWNPLNLKVVAMVQKLTDVVGYNPIFQSQSANINQLNPDPDQDGYTYFV